ncbi:hypothetical protein WA026_019149 [Henosepilachna vigintioctopunctata]|uniref:Carboxylesterase type B domain-containing protein n=1 Tax=Henosepilachna vigintioctopunctata TaxID=420089 RepID=A0AAW1V3M7_9CUCU
MDKTVVRISDGDIKGRQRKDVNGSTFLSFEGIPYGKPPVGNLRFKAPLPVDPWNGVKDALVQDLGSLCKQETFIQNEKGLSRTWSLEGSEDCLNLNVYTRELPDTKNSTLKPVMVFIHGGAWVTGTTRMYGPEILMTEDVVLVTVHYRLGAFGFLVLDDPNLGVSGNAAMKDQVLALKWIQKNISAFNGDNKNVTIFGHSAGAASVTLLMLSPSATGLFHKAAIQSGSVLSSWMVGNSQNAKHLAGALGFTGTDEKEILKFLQQQSAEKIYEAQLKLTDTIDPSQGRYFAFVVENKESKDAFLTEQPIELLKSGKYNQIPILTGYTNMEGLYLTLKDEGSPFGAKCFEEESLPPLALGLERNSEEFNKVVREIRKFYYGESEPKILSLPTTQLCSDSTIIRGVIKQAKHFSKAPNQSVYLYRISVPMNHGEPFSSSHLNGVPHGGELPFLFKMNIEPKLLFSDATILRNKFIKLWTNFAKYGNPIQSEEFINVKWKTVEKERMNFLDIADNMTVGIDPEKERMAFWDQLFGNYPPAVDY